VKSNSERLVKELTTAQNVLNETEIKALSRASLVAHIVELRFHVGTTSPITKFVSDFTLAHVDEEVSFLGGDIPVDTAQEKILGEPSNRIRQCCCSVRIPWRKIRNCTFLDFRHMQYSLVHTLRMCP